MEQRLFSGCELFCQPVSFATFIAIPAMAVQKICGYAIPAWWTEGVFPVLLSAAIGYLTNWVAIEMLFKPYHPTYRHLFAWITFGYWKQGLVPKNKERIAVKIGETVATDLLKPDELANDLCDMAGHVLENKELMQEVKATLQQQLLDHGQEIVNFLAPRIENGIVTEIDHVLTADNIRVFWDEQIVPRLTSDDMRERLAGLVLKGIEKKAPDIAERLKPTLAQIIKDYCLEKGGPMFGSILAKMAEELTDRLLSKQTIEDGIGNWLNNPDTMSNMCADLASVINAVRDYLKSPELDEQMSMFISQMRDKFIGYLRNWLQENFPLFVNRILNSEELWSYVTCTMSSCRPQLEQFVREHGMPLILEKLNIRERVREAIDKQDMERFHGMINEVAAQHLGAIQVLGYLLGGVAGALMLLVN